MNNLNKSIYNEPYRILFPIGIFYLLWGIFLWIPQIWSQESYPVLLHRTLVLNGFMAMFVGGFLMTAIPKFSRTHFAKKNEVLTFLILSILIIAATFVLDEKFVLILSSIQAFLLFLFAYSRFKITNASPPFTFVFIFVGVILWFISGVAGKFFSEIPQTSLQYDGAILAFIIGIGSKLIPGILGHNEILTAKSLNTSKQAFLKEVPLYFYILMLFYIGSFFIESSAANWIRFFIVLFVSMKFWKLYKTPPTKTALTRTIWLSSWLILLSVLLKAIWIDGFIHAGHSFFINGIVLLSILIATRVLVAHGPMNSKLEDSKWIYTVSFFIILAAATRVSAFLMPETYYRHLAYSSISLGFGLIIWAINYLKYVRVFPNKI